ncbi:alpha/beta-hydrolase [Massarina eburnea CBS 473.64]|uniref:Alpha/beta-hydrolase n=1 Tax=Massarina eburnea CBS 473.64 TaxID=1395130 RepID=A0A6A6S4E4_9PLEO|nr:alpha/beta-hydrolase [Massarina eburnea CBS 473.64]
MADVYVVSPTTAHTHTIIFLHGRGSNAAEFASEFFESQDRQDRYLQSVFPSIKWVFPCAKMRWAAIEQETMCQWFDMASVLHPNQQMDMQKEGLRESVEGLMNIMESESEVQGIGMNRIFLAGISQGCATAIIALFCSGVRLAGFIGLSSWLPFSDEIIRFQNYSLTDTKGGVRALLGLAEDDDQMQIPAAQLTPVLLEHCLDDLVVPSQNGKDLEEKLRLLGMQVKMKIYSDGGHWVNEPTGIDDMVEFIEQNLLIVSS